MRVLTISGVLLLINAHSHGQSNERIQRTWKGPDSQNVVTMQKWWTVDERGLYSVNGDSLTITPRTSKATLRNLNGVVHETRPNQVEKVTYKWTTHFFEGIGETNLVLQPPSATNRDGVLGGDNQFPNAYLYIQGDRLEWRF